MLWLDLNTARLGFAEHREQLVLLRRQIAIDHQWQLSRSLQGLGDGQCPKTIEEKAVVVRRAPDQQCGRVDQGQFARHAQFRPTTCAIQQEWTACKFMVQQRSARAEAVENDFLLVEQRNPAKCGHDRDAS
ncbi:hypothetical protein ASC67_08725 [Methylibium sp. Root1272]|nr:hypothetical protein ASC67_08725 [Methylibium sp. Root1272]